MTLRIRLTLIFLAFLTPALLLFGGATYYLARERIYQSVDDGLERQVISIDGLLDTRESLSILDIEENIGAFDLQAVGSTFQITDPAGNLLYSSQNGPLPAAGTVQPGFRTVTNGDDRVRALARPVVRVGRVVGLIEARESLADADSLAASIALAGIIGGVAVLAGATVPAYLLAGRAIRPVDELAALASEIETTADFSRRLSGNPSPREISRLSTAFNRMVERVDHMIAAQRTFLADSSHELRRPLTILTTNLEVLGNPGLSAEERAEVTQEMRDEIGRMNGLLSDLLVLARSDLEPQRRQQVDLSELCLRAVHKARTLHQDHTFEASIEPSLGIFGDPARLALAVENLLQNAATYTPPGGRIDLGLSRGPAGIVLEVSDTGPGLTQEDLNHVFERFYRGSAARENRADGTGLGLAIVRRVADAHAAEVTATSAPGTGARFIVAFPAISRATS
jgi:two-component system sensor histidine kinase MprB